MFENATVNKLLSGVLSGTILSGIASLGAAPALAACPGDNCQPIVVCEWVDVPCGSKPDGGFIYCREWRCVEDCRDCNRPSLDDVIRDFEDLEIPPFDPEPFDF